MFAGRFSEELIKFVDVFVKFVVELKFVDGVMKFFINFIVIKFETRSFMPYFES